MRVLGDQCEFTVSKGNSFVRLLISNLRRTHESSDGPPGKTPQYLSDLLHRTAASLGDSAILAVLARSEENTVC